MVYWVVITLLLLVDRGFQAAGFGGGQASRCLGRGRFWNRRGGRSFCLECLGRMPWLFRRFEDAFKTCCSTRHHDNHMLGRRVHGFYKASTAILAIVDMTDLPSIAEGVESCGL